MAGLSRASSTLAASLVVLAASVGCTGPKTPTLPGDPRVCTAVAVQALNVTVLDAVSRQRVCDASVVAVDGAFREALRAFGSEADCVYAGPTERSGVYEVRASKPGYQPATASDLRVTEDVCHVIPLLVTITLTR